MVHETGVQVNDPELTECVDAQMRWLEGSGGESGEEMAATESEVDEIWQAGWTAGREGWRRALLTIADDTNDIATYWAICDLIGEEPPSPEPRPRP
jgi:hypothetical protein